MRGLYGSRFYTACPRKPFNCSTFEEGSFCLCREILQFLKTRNFLFFDKRSFNPVPFVLVAFIVMLSSRLMGQQFLNYSSLDRSNGLISNNVYSLAQDSSGVLWLGTDLGLVRYDGIEANLVLPKDKKSIVVLKLFKDQAHRIWISTFHNGLYFIENDSIKESPINPLLMRAEEINPIIYVRNLFVSKDDRIHFSLNCGTHEFYSAHIDSSRVDTHNIPNLNKGDLYLVNNESEHFVISGRHMRLTDDDQAFDIENKITVWPTDYGGPIAYSNYGIDNYTGLAWSGKLLHKSNRYNDTLQLSGAINDISLIDSNIFISTNNGLYRFSQVNGELKQKAYYLKGKVISKIIRDREGVYWVSTVGSGCLAVSSLNSVKVVIPQLEKVLNEYSHCFYSDSILSLYNEAERTDINIAKDFELNQRILTESYGNNVQSYQLKDGSDIFYVPAGKKSFLEIPYTGYFYRKKDGETLYKASLFFDEEDNYGRQYHRIYAESEEEFYLLTSQGFFVARSDSSIYDSYQDGFRKQITSIAPRVAENTLYIGCREGVYEFNMNSKTWDLILEDKAISDVRFASDLGLIAATKGEGLFIYNNEKWTNISLGANFVDNVVKQIYLWEGKVFLRTFNDLILLETEANEVSGYKKSSLFFFGDASAQDLLFSSGKPILLGQEGLVTIDTNIFNYPFKNDAYLDELSVNSQVLNRNDVNGQDLNYKENNLSLELKLSTLHNNTRNKIRYKLKGSQQDWVETQSKSLSFLGLEPGSYSLSVMAENAIGQWSAPKEVLVFTINPPFYKTWWFALSTALALALLTWLTYYSGTKVSQREKQLLLANITALKRQINPHFVLNALSSIRYYQQSNNLEKAEIYINRLANLFTNIVYSSDNKRVLLSDEIERIESFVTLEEARFDGRLKFEFKLEDGLKAERLFIPPMLIQPIVENALEHGLKEVENPKLSIEIRQEEGVITICVKDNGPGIEADILKNLDSQKSVGISNVLKRVELIRQLEGKDLSIKLSNDNGLKVVLKIEQ